jgi:hypothetical protein
LDQQQWLSLQNHGSERAAPVAAVQGQIHMRTLFCRLILAVDVWEHMLKPWLQLSWQVNAESLKKVLKTT